MLEEKRFVILGAGPSGLSFAHGLIAAGVPRHEILVLEREPVPGGLCRSEVVDGAPLDTGGGHFLDVTRERVLEFLFRFMPRDEWQAFDRVAKIRLRGLEVDHPLESNLWQLPVEAQVEYLESIAQAGSVRGEEMPHSFAAWIEWKLGARIAQEYMLPYNRKIWSMDPDTLGTYWLNKLPSVSFRETLASCLERRPLGVLPAHGRFLYPKHHGYGEAWRRLGDALGDSLATNCPVESVDINRRLINDKWRAGTVVTTIPWTYWPTFSRMPIEVKKCIGMLKSASVDIDYHRETPPGLAHWVYEPDEGVSYHRLLLRSNFATGSRGHWTETNSIRAERAVGVRFRNEFAYPVNTLGKPEAIDRVLTWAKGRRIVGLGRWGRWEHLNSDVAVAEALELAHVLASEKPE